MKLTHHFDMPSTAVESAGIARLNELDVRQQPDRPRSKFKITCSECGLPYDVRFATNHEKGLLHWHHRRIRALIEANCLSFDEIGQRFLVTREAVRQWAQLLGMPTGRTRMKVCTLASRARRAQSLVNGTQLGRFAAACEQHGLPWRFATTKSKTRGEYFSAKECLVQEYRVRVLSASCNSRGYIQLHSRKASRVDFTVFELPNGKWLILPQNMVKQTMFAEQPDPNGSGATSENRHDYCSFIEAWRLFR